MGRPYSLDLRERVVAAMRAGMDSTEAADVYKISERTARRWYQRDQETGSPAALPMGGKKPFALKKESEWILARMAEKPDITGRALLSELHERKVDVSYYGVWHFLDHAGLSFKKKAFAPVNRTVLTLQDGASNGNGCREVSIPGASFLSMKPGPRRT
jgi:transposase